MDFYYFLHVGPLLVTDLINALKEDVFNCELSGKKNFEQREKKKITYVAFFFFKLVHICGVYAVNFTLNAI